MYVNFSEGRKQILEIPDMRRPLMMISYTKEGARLCRRLKKEDLFSRCSIFVPEKYVEDGVSALPADVRAWISEEWGKSDFLFVCAAGIAVRMTAHCVNDKYNDAAVLVMDEKGQFIIPLLSGHVGGGVSLARAIGDSIGAIPVITTATDVQEKFAVDVFAVRNHLVITDRDKAKEISAAVLSGHKIGIWIEPESEQEIRFTDVENRDTVLCRTLEEFRQYEYGVVVSHNRKEIGVLEEGKICCLHLAAGKLVIGIGCRKDISCEEIRSGVRECLNECGFSERQIEAVVSIDLKANEPGLCAYCEELHVPFITYSSGQLKETGEVSSSSSFVKQVTGIDNVCERAVRKYLMDHGSGALIQEKKCLHKMTVAIGCV